MCSRADFCFQRCANRQIVFILHFNAVVGASPSAWRVVSLALSTLAKPQVSLGTLGSTIVCINETFDIYVNCCLFLHNRTETIVLLISSVENAKWPNICCWVRLAFYPVLPMTTQSCNPTVPRRPEKTRQNVQCFMWTLETSPVYLRWGM